MVAREQCQHKNCKLMNDARLTNELLLISLIKKSITVYRGSGRNPQNNVILSSQ